MMRPAFLVSVGTMHMDSNAHAIQTKDETPRRNQL
jgi:hypothetical protein